MSLKIVKTITNGKREENKMNYIGMIFSFMIPGMVIGGMATSLVREAIIRHEKVKASTENRIGMRWVSQRVGE